MGLLLLMGDSGFRGALDTLGSGLESAWSVGRRLRTAYTGPIIRVRRSSDNVEQDFSGSGSLGAVNPSAVAAFCGAGDGFLTTIYDQSNLARNLTQATTTAQPQVVASGVANTSNGRLTPIYAAAAAKFLRVASSRTTYRFLHGTGLSTSFWLCSVNNTATSKVLTRTVNFAGNQNGVITMFLSDESLYAQISSNNNQTPALRNVGTAWTGAQSLTQVFDPANATVANRMIIWRNRSLIATGANTQTGTAAVIDADQDYTVGADFAGGNGFDGWIGEHYIWSTDQTANRLVFEDSAHSFWGI